MYDNTLALENSEKLLIPINNIPTRLTSKLYVRAKLPYLVDIMTGFVDSGDSELNSTDR